MGIPRRADPLPRRDVRLERPGECARLHAVLPQDAAGKVAGLYCANAERAVACAKRGFRFLAVNSDLGFLRAGTAAQLKTLNG